MTRLIRWFMVCAIAGALMAAALLQIRWYHADSRIVRVEHDAIRVDCDRIDVLCDDEGA